MTLRGAQRRLLAELAGPTAAMLHAEPALVDGVVAGGAADGSTLVTVNWRDEPGIPVPYLDSYLPTEGDVVLLLAQGPQLLIAGRITGPPDMPDDGSDSSVLPVY